MTYESDFPYPDHGGNIPWACAQFGIEAENWIDLSTGISPWPWPVPPIPQHIFQQLPYSDFGLLNAASKYYGCHPETIVAIPGSQYAIQNIPQLIPPCTVALPKIGYKEHQNAWIAAGHTPNYYSNAEQLITLIETENISCAVVINPNNPTTELCNKEILQKIEYLLLTKHGDQSLLLIDEAFVDTIPHMSYIENTREKNTVILRSVGKFFGLAGIRLGFLIAHKLWQERIQQKLGAWPINAPAMYTGQKALTDYSWIKAQNERINSQSAEFFSFLSNTLKPFLANKSTRHSSCHLFYSVFGPNQTLYKLFVSLAENGVLTRYISHPQKKACLRFGLPGQNLNIAMQKIIQSTTSPC